MKKLLSIVLSVLLIAAVFAVPMSAEAVGVQSKEIRLMDYSEFTFDAPEDTYPWNHYIVSQIDDGEIEYDTFMEDVGTYDSATNTLTLKNLQPEGDHRYELSIVGMENLTLRVVGECYVENINVMRTSLTVTGPGKLYVNNNADFDGVQVRVSSGAFKIGSDAYVNIRQSATAGEEKEYVTAPIRFGYVGNETKLGEVFSYEGNVSPELDWEKSSQDENYNTFTLKNTGDITFSPVSQHQEESYRYSFFYAPSDEELSAGSTYSIWMYNTYLDNKENKTEWNQTGSQLGTYGKILSSEGRAVFGLRSSFQFNHTSKLWVNINTPNSQSNARTITLDNVDLENLDEKVIFPDGSIHELDEKTYTFAYAPSDQQLYRDYDYYAYIRDELHDYESIPVKLSKPDTIKYSSEGRKAAVGSITTKVQFSRISIMASDEQAQNPFSILTLDDVALADYSGKAIFPDKTLHELEVIEIPEEDDSEGVAPNASTPEKPKLDPVDPAQYNDGYGYIQVENPADTENYGAEIVNLFYSTETRTYKGMSYDLATNTLTLDNVKGSTFDVMCDAMYKLNIKLVGTNEIGSLGFWDTYPHFTGTGSLTIDNPVQIDVSEEPFRAGVEPMAVDNTAKVTLNKGEDEACAFVTVVTYEDNVNFDQLIKYKGGVSEPLDWQLRLSDMTGGLTETEARLSGIRMRTKFKATELLKKTDGDGTAFYVKSISHVGNDPLIYHHISQLVEKDGIWYEKDDGTSYWNKDYLFTSLSSEEIAALPSTLVDENGVVTAYLATQFDYGDGYVKDGKVFALNREGRARNLIVNPSYPPKSLYEKDVAPFLLMRVVKQFNDGDMNISLVRYEEEYNLNNSGNPDIREAFLKEKGYERYKTMVFNPYYYTFKLLNKSVTFTPTAKIDISKCTVSGIKSKTYNAKAQTQTITVKDGSATLKSGTDYSVSYKNNKNAGTATVTITGKGNYTGSVNKTFKIAKAAQPMKVTANTKSFKAKTAKKAKVSIKKAITVKNNQGAISYTKVSKGTSKGLSITSKGVISVKKGTYKKGSTLKINVKVTAKGNSNYKSGSKTVTVKIKVK